jgi:hypothetical protein
MKKKVVFFLFELINLEIIHERKCVDVVVKISIIIFILGHYLIIRISKKIISLYEKE